MLSIRTIKLSAFLICALLVFKLSGNESDSLRKALSTNSGEERLEVMYQLGQEALVSDSVLIWGKRLSTAAKSQKNVYYEALGLHLQAMGKSSLGNTQASILDRRKAIELFKSIDRKDKMARQYLSLGNSFSDLAEYDSALATYQTAQDLAIESKDTLAITGTYLNISTVFHEMGDRENELKNLLIAHDIMQQKKDSSQLGIILYNLSVFYLESGELDKSAELLSVSAELYRAQNNQFGLASVYNLYAQRAFDQQKVDSAMYFLDKSIRIYEELGEMSRVAFIYLNQGQTLGMAGQWQASLEKLSVAYKQFTQMGEKRYAGIALHAMSASEQELGNNKRAIELLEEAIAIAESIGSFTHVSEWYRELAELYRLNGDFLQANKALLKLVEVNDTLQKMNKHDAIQEMEAKYQNEKKQLEIENLEQDRALQKAQMAKERTQRLLLIGGLIAALVLLLLIGYGFMLKRRDNRIIQEQKTQVEQQRDQVNHQRLLLEEKNREITDSIIYAKRIQEAILPPSAAIEKHLSNSFIFYQPKAIVAGDFYWMQAEGDTVFFASADCTGHGVPGALVSVVCSDALNRAVREFELREPAQILDKTRDLVIERFEKSEKDVKDGMDIALCALNTKTLDVQFAGAQNPLWIVTNAANTVTTDSMIPYEAEEDDMTTLYEIKGDKQPIGKFSEPVPFTNHHVKLQKGDSIYLFSDGYADQFGGPRAKKFKYKPFKDLILSLNELPIEKQKVRLVEHFNSWRGELEQIDDVCVIGVRV